MDFDTFLEGIFVLGFQDPATHVMAGIVDLHNYIFTYIVFIIIAVFWMLLCIGWDFHRRINRPRLNLAFISKRIQLIKNRTVNHGEALEIVWTITPSLILVAIAIPSFALLYSLDETLFPSVTLKAIGHQWYWSYEYGDKAFVFDDENNSTSGSVISFDSNMVPEQELKIGELRLLQVDNPIILPMDLHVRIIVTSADVLHSWAVPSLGIKIDGVPGRLNQVYTFINHEGTFYGQCSELCGVNHGFMPIVIYSVTAEDFNIAFANQSTN